MENLRLNCEHSEQDYLLLDFKRIGEVIVNSHDRGEETEITLSEENAKYMCDHLKKQFGWD